jgi:EmrB/QacA subfamily drug resistance transporter
MVPLIIGCALCLEALDTTIITTALPVMARSLHEDPIRLNLAITSYLLSLAVFVPLSGWVADTFGARKVFRVAIVIFTFGSVLCGVSHSLLQLVGARVLQGFGGAMLVPVGRLVVLKTVEKSELVQAMAYLSVPWMIGPVIGPPLGGFIVTYYSWRWIFFINVPVCIIGLILVTLFVPHISEEDVPPFDFPGFVLTGIGLAGVVFGLETVGRAVIPAPIVAAALLGGSSALLLYGWHARRSRFPIVELRLFDIRTFSVATLGGGLYRMGVGAMPFVLALLLQVGFGLTPFASGMLTFMSAAGSIFMRLTVHRIVRMFGFRRTLMVNGVISAGSVLLCVIFTQQTPHSIIALILFIGGFFRSLQFTTLTALTYADIPSPMMSNASSLASMAQQLAASLGVTIAAITLRITVATHGGRLTAHDVDPAFIITALLCLSSILSYRPLSAFAGSEITGQRTGRGKAPETEPVSAVAGD